jgi:hypothetical protein
MDADYFSNIRGLIARYTASVHLLLDLLWLSWAVSVISLVAAALICVYAARDGNETTNMNGGGT